MNTCKAKLLSGLRFLILICLAVCITGPQPARAAGPWFVAPAGHDDSSCLNPTAPCATINAAIAKASSGDTLYVAIGTYTGNTTDAVVTIGKDLILSGGWDAGFTSQTGMSVIDGQGSRRGVYFSDGIVTLERFIIQHGYDGIEGGGIYKLYGSLTLNHCLVKNNTSGWLGGGVLNQFGSMALNETVIRDNSGGLTGYGGGGGGGIYNYQGTVTINNSTVSGNQIGSGFDGSGIYNQYSATMTLNNSTVSGNTGSQHAIQNSGTMDLNSSTVANNQGGLANLMGNVQLRNTIVANKSRDCNSDPNYSGTVTSLGYNLIETNQNCTLDGSDLTNIDPELGLLQENGGSTPTQALLPGSPAINAGDPSGCMGSAGLLTTDQRGFSRSDRCDIGAHELKPLDSSYMTVTPGTAQTGSLVTFTLTLANSSATGIDNVSVTDILPDSLTYLDGSLTFTNGNANYAAGVITWTGTANAGNTRAITFNAMINQMARGSVITNELIIQSGEESFPRTAQVRVPPPFLVYMPLVTQPAPGIYGHVTLNGAAVAGVSLELRFFDGTYWSTLQTTSTNSDGSYAFTDILDLVSGQAYYVRFLNPATSTDGRLSAWYTPVISHYAAPQVLIIGAFDIADVSLVGPVPGAKVALPKTFHWTKRSATPGDSYQFELFDPSGSSDFITPLLGYVDSYSLLGLPTGFVKNISYGWSVWVNSADGGYGAAFYYRTITFTNAGSSLFLPPTTAARRNLVDRGEEFIQKSLP